MGEMTLAGEAVPASFARTSLAHRRGQLCVCTLAAINCYGIRAPGVPVTSPVCVSLQPGNLWQFSVALGRVPTTGIPGPIGGRTQKRHIK